MLPVQIEPDFQTPAKETFHDSEIPSISSSSRPMDNTVFFLYRGAGDLVRNHWWF